ncbi:MAG: peptidylprolyl isomerase [Candidatus Omnitrophica bacterium]|nr:peptidylprolyl isomerase [Candidatus Omnitrophota bacterium]
MLSVLRHKGVSRKILWVVSVIIILSFAVFGTAWRLDKSVNSAGKIFGHTVSLMDWQKAYYDTRDSAILMYGDNFFKYGNRLNLEAQTWDRLVLLEEAKKRNVQVSDQEIVDFIATMPFFQTQGKFDQYKYESIVSDPRGFDRKTIEFEGGIRTQLMIKKLLEQVTGELSMTDPEVKKEYILKNEKIKLVYALFEPLKAAKDIKVSDDEIKKYYDAHQEQFRKPIMVNVESATVNFPEKATTEQKEVARKAITALAKELKTNTDFKALALAHKIEVKESGLFSQAQPLLSFAWSPELVEKIFAMKQGQFSPAFEMPDGWQILRIKEYKDSSIPALAAIKEDVKNSLLTDKGFTLAKTKADAALKVISQGLKANKSFKDLALGVDAKVDQTNSFGRGEYVANMGLIAEFQEETLKMNMQNRLSEVISTSQGPAIVYLDSIEGIDEKQFESDKTNFKEMMLAQKRSQITAEFVTQLRLKANIQSQIDKHKAK